MHLLNSEKYETLAMNDIDLHTLYDKGSIDDADWAFARTIQRLGPCDDAWSGLAAALVSRAASEGHVCLDLAEAHRQALAEITMEAGRAPMPELDDWVERVRACPAVGAAGDFCPLILQGRRLYLHRYWCFEQELAQSIAARCAQPLLRAEEDPELDAVLAGLFADPGSDQCAAARMAATRRFSVISGGPGTGKTFTVGKIILLLQALYPQRPLKILLAAPTGKAAARLQAAVEAMLDQHAATQAPATPGAQTLHRLLGYMPSAAKFRFDTKHPLMADAVIVDEASMIDLVLMRQLVQAVPAKARLILVGDKDQLASVEAGAVLGDICHGINRTARTDAESARLTPASSYNAAEPTLARHIVVLERSYRFDAQGGIGALGRAINAGDSQKVQSLLGDPHESSIVFRPLAHWASWAKILEDEIIAAVGPLFDCRDPSAAFDQLSRFKILCAVRKGPYGIEAMNQRIEQIMRRTGRIAPASHGLAGWYAGRPVMITRNDYFHGLFNGDVGIAMNSGPNQDMRVIFPAAEGGFKSLQPQQLPEHQTVYAMTIHKSQGSEFEQVMIVLPDEDVPLLTRELIYTAVTRARRSIVIWAPPELLARAVERPIRRASGLREMLWGGLGT
ncbi:MAG: exodeoxyribonuclease V subunit alpha [Desulfobacteraceae bacterium]|nr:MAG: exodeoxyribonuclease V subunit alpha [Desulfobacteraceae bacterium]